MYRLLKYDVQEIIIKLVWSNVLLLRQMLWVYEWIYYVIHDIFLLTLSNWRVISNTCSSLNCDYIEQVVCYNKYYNPLPPYLFPHPSGKWASNRWEWSRSGILALWPSTPQGHPQLCLADPSNCLLKENQGNLSGLIFLFEK